MYTTDAPIRTFPMGMANIIFNDWYLNNTPNFTLYPN
jgi:hypothetical protein